MKQKILFIAPHLSTGGLPQYLYKQIESIHDDMDVYCIEWANITGGNLVVQRNRIEQILRHKLITLYDNKNELFTHIDRINPSVIHLQEIPELFMENDVAEKLYDTNRSYTIIETSHDSSFNVQHKIYFPDKFLMVSKYQINQYEPLGVPIDLVEYPIENKVRTKTREQALLELGLDPNLRHVINVGLFTPRKNQAEAIEYARQLQHYPIQFHFLGNHADNFRYYWEPLMKDFPSNCKWWNERDDVDAFYEAADLFLFTSRGNDSDKETMPLVIREALSWKTPSMIYNLPVYMGYFDKYDTIEYLSDDMEKNINRIREKLCANVSTYKFIPVNYEFASRWDLTSRTIHYSVNKKVNFPILISLKEYKSDAVMWSTVLTSMDPNIEFWMRPGPVEDTHFTGVKLCIYNDATGEQLYEHPYVHKFVNIPSVILSNAVPYYNNYLEYFVDKKYDKWLNRPYNTVIDVGANVGVFTAHMLMSNSAKTVVAVECDNKALADLQHNFRHMPMVTIIPKALSSTSEPVTFYHSPQNPVISSTLSPDELESHNAGIKGNVTMTVDAITLRQLVDTYGKIDLLKIDIEGGEYSVLLNADDSVFNSINNIFLECHFFEKDYKEKYSALLNKLTRVGYTVEEFSPNQSDFPATSEAIFASKV